MIGQQYQYTVLRKEKCNSAKYVLELFLLGGVLFGMKGVENIFLQRGRQDRVVQNVNIKNHC